MIDRFGGKIERALAAYNAGPHRVAVWNLARPGMSAEEFVDSIPFSETRQLRHDHPRLAGALPPHLRAGAAGRRRRGHGSAAVKGFRIGDFKLKIDPAILPPKGRFMRSDGRALDQLRPVTITPALHQARGGLRPHRGRRHQGHLHGQRRGPRAAVPEGPGRGLDHRRVRDAAARHLHPLAARGHEGPRLRAAPTRSSASSAARCARWWT